MYAKDALTQVTEWVKELADKLNIDDAEFEIVDIKDYELPLFNEAMPPAMANKQYTSEDINRWSQKLTH